MIFDQSLLLSTIVLNDICTSLLMQPLHFIYVLARVPALCAGWGRVSYDCAFGAPTCGLKKFVTKGKNVHSKF